MSEQAPTPETDTFAATPMKSGETLHDSWRDFAHKLERQRDEARAKLAKRQANAPHLQVIGLHEAKEQAENEL